MVLSMQRGGRALYFLKNCVNLFLETFQMNRENTVAQIVQEAINKSEYSVAGAAKRWGVNRNFLIDILSGKVPRARSGRRLASDDPRYLALARGIGHPISEFCTLIEAQQRSHSSSAVVSITPHGVVIHPHTATAGRIERIVLVIDGVEVRIEMRRQEE